MVTEVTTVSPFAEADLTASASAAAEAIRGLFYVRVIKRFLCLDGMACFLCLMAFCDVGSCSVGCSEPQDKPRRAFGEEDNVIRRRASLPRWRCCIRNVLLEQTTTRDIFNVIAISVKKVIVRSYLLRHAMLMSHYASCHQALHSILAKSLCGHSGLFRYLLRHVSAVKKVIVRS